MLKNGSGAYLKQIQSSEKKDDFITGLVGALRSHD